MANIWKSFVSRYMLTIVMIPSLIGIHYGWSVMQNNRKLVTKEEQIELPPITLAKYAWRKISGDTTNIEGNSKPVN